MAFFSKLLVPAIAGTLLVNTLSAQVTLTRDINTTKGEFQSVWENTNPFFPAGSTLYFKNRDFAGGELWKTNGTASGTQRVIDLNKGTGDGFYTVQGSLASQLQAGGGLAFNGKFIFVGDDGTTGGELWITDGTEAGTTLLKDIVPGPATSYINYIRAFQGNVYFSASDDTNTSFWRSDGTPEGTVLIKTIGGKEKVAFEVSQTSNHMFLMFYSFDENFNVTFDLWTSDGTETGTVLLHTFANFAYNFAVAGDKVLFAFYRTNGAPGSPVSQLWVSDGTQAGTHPVRDFETETPNNLAPYGGNKVMFSSFSITQNLWVSDGTDEGTIMLYPDVYITAYATIGNIFYAVGNNYALNSIALVKSDGTPEGTEQVAELGALSQQAGPIRVINNKLLLSIYSEQNGNELGISDGTAAGTFLLKDINPGPQGSTPRGFQDFNGKVVFVADDGVHGNQPWITDGTEAGTILLKDVTPGTAGSYPGELQVLGDQLIFTASSIGDLPRDVWKSDANGTELFTNFDGASFTPNYLGRRDTVLYYFNSGKLYKLNGLPDGTATLGDFSGGGDGAFTLGEKTILILTTDKGTEFWVTDGSAAGTEILKDINPGSGSGATYTYLDASPSELGLVRNNSQFIFSATDGATGFELWTSNGTEGGTHQLADIYAGTAGSQPSSFVELNGNVYFSADDGVHGRELWRTDGTAGGTVQFTGTETGSLTANPGSLVKAGNVIFFQAHDNENGWTVWTTDGTPEGTRLVKSHYWASLSLTFTVTGSKVFFSADDGHGLQPWVSDGTSDGTFMIQLPEGPGTSPPSLFTTVNDLTYFQAHDQLWRSDGISPQAEFVADIAPIYMTYFNNLLYCTAPSLEYGFELFTVSTKINQAIAFAELPVMAEDDPVFALQAPTTSNLTVSYTSSDPSVATVTDGIITIIGPGTTTITAHQEGNDIYNAATAVARVLKVKALQTITFGGIPDKTLGDDPFTLEASASSSLAVTYSNGNNKVSLSGNEVTLVDAGRTSITAVQIGDETFREALPKLQSFCINPARPVITVSGTNPLSSTLASSTADGNQWYFNGSAVPNATGSELSVDASGTYSVQVKSDDCLSQFSADKILVVTGLKVVEYNTLEAYPNPAENYLEIRGLGAAITAHQLYDMTGKQADLEFERKGASHIANVEGLTKGIYLLRIQEGELSRQVKFIKK